MVYPLMQAVDIAMLGVDVAVGGIDQRKIHMLARQGLTRLGYRAPVCVHMPILLGLDGEKMSSSKGNYISVDDTEQEVISKLKKERGHPEFSGFRSSVFTLVQPIYFTLI